MEKDGENFEIKLPENIEIPESEEGGEESEGEIGEVEEGEVEVGGKEELENIIEQPPATFVRRMDAEQITPFLEAEPIENLEQDLENVPGQTTQTEQTAQAERGQEQPEVYNAPQYSGYETMEGQRPADPEMAIGGALMRRETDMMEARPERRIDFQRWQQTHAERGAEQQERYKIREPEKLREEDKLPFQRKRRRGEF